MKHEFPIRDVVEILLGKPEYEGQLIEEVYIKDDDLLVIVTEERRSRK